MSTMTSCGEQQQQPRRRAVTIVRPVRVVARDYPTAGAAFREGDACASAAAAASTSPLRLLQCPPATHQSTPLATRCSLHERRWWRSSGDGGGSRSRSNWMRRLLVPLLLLALLSSSVPSSLLPLPTPAHASRLNCSAATGDCIRIGLFYCADDTAPSSGATPPPSLLPPSSCAGVRAYNVMLDWYRARVANQLQGRIAGVPVHFVPLTLPPYSPSRREFAALVNATFFADDDDDDGLPGNSSRALVDFVILPPGGAWDEAMLRLEHSSIPAISAHAPLASLFQCSGTAAALQPPCVAPNTRRFEYAHGLASTADQFLLSWVSLLGLRKVSTLAVVVATDAEAATDPLGLASPRGLRAKMLQPMRVGVLQAARENHIRIVANEGIMLRTASYVPDSAARQNRTLVERDAATIAKVVARITALAPQALALITLDCGPWLAALREANYAPGATAATFCVREQNLAHPAHAASFSSASDTLYVVDSTQWSPRTRGHAVTENRDNSPWALFPHVIGGNTTALSSPRQFERLWQELMQRSIGGDGGATGAGVGIPGWSEAAVLASLSMLEGALMLSAAQQLHGHGSASGSGIAPALVNRQLQLYFQPSFIGWITTNRFGFNQQKSLVMLQRAPTHASASASTTPSASDSPFSSFTSPSSSSSLFSSSVVEIVAPQSAAGMDFIYPAPTWSERVYERRVLGRFQVEWVVLALVCTCAAATLALIMALARYRAFFAHSQRFAPHNAVHSRFFMAVGLGCLVGYSSTLVWNVDNDSIMCAARAWIWPIAVHLVADPLVSACICITRATQTNRAPLGRKLRCMDRATLSQRIAAGALLLALPQVLFNLLWVFAFGGLDARIVVVDPLRASSSYTSCVCTSAACDALVLVSTVYGLGVLAVGVVYAWRMRKSAPLALFRDAHAISLALALFALTAAVVLAVQIALSSSSDEAFSHAVLHGLRSLGTLVAFQGCFVMLVLRRLLDGMTLAGVVGGGGARRAPGAADGARAGAAAGAAAAAERRAQERAQPNGVNTAGMAMQLEQRNSDALHHRVGLPSHALKSRASATTPRAGPGAGAGHGNGGAAGVATPGGVTHGPDARLARHQAGSPSAVQGSRTLAPGAAGHPPGALSMAVGMVTPSITGRELDREGCAGESMLSMGGPGFPDVFSRAAAAGPGAFGPPPPAVEMGLLGPDAMGVGNMDTYMRNGIDQSAATLMAAAAATVPPAAGLPGVVPNGVRSGGAPFRLVVPVGGGPARPSISVIQESPSPGHGPLDTTPTPSPAFTVCARRDRSSLSPTSPHSPSAHDSDHFGSSRDSSGAYSTRPRVASMMLPAECVLPDANVTAALDSATLHQWRCQISSHAEQIEVLVPLKEAEQHLIRARSPDLCESDASDPRHKLSPHAHRHPSTRIGAGVVAASAAAAGSLLPYSSSQGSASSSQTTSPRFASAGNSAQPSSMHSDGQVKSRESLPSLRNRSSAGNSSASNPNSSGAGAVASPLTMPLSPLLCASPSVAGPVVARPVSTSGSSSRTHSASRVAQSPDDASAPTLMQFDLATSSPDLTRDNTDSQPQPSALASAVPAHPHHHQKPPRG